MSVHQAIIPAAGLGTRFLPVTKVIPKELLPIMAKPSIQFVVEELVESGVNEIIFVLSPEKESVFHYFSDGSFVDQILDQRGHQERLVELRQLLEKVKFRRVYQTNPLGLGDAVRCAEKHITSDYFVLALPDDIIFSNKPCSQMLIEHCEATNHSVLAVEKVEPQQLSSYGIISYQQNNNGKVFHLDGMVEKPTAEQAPSQRAVIGRYVLSKKIFSLIDEKAQAGHEIQITDAISRMIEFSGVDAIDFEGVRVDVGQPIGFAKANILHARRQNLISEANIQNWLKNF
jgi:UTP--glucose-1-phosphate uridylyltransferase